MRDPIHILLADPHPLIRIGLRTLLTPLPQIELIGVVADGYAAQRHCQEYRPDLLLLDPALPGPPDAEIMTVIQTDCPAIRVLILTTHADDTTVRSLLTAGVAGYLLKDEAPEVLVQAIERVAQGGTWFSQTIAARMVAWTTSPPAAVHGLERPTVRELQILRGVARGWTNACIAHELGVSERTVRQHLEKLFMRLEVSNRTEAVMVAQQRGLLEP
ncbi:MAG: response regulator [Chloroflexaceae bacterium]